MIVGYARTSTSDQTAGLEAQARDLKAAGAEKVFSEQVSSTAQRAKLAECLAFLREGDALVVTKPDRLARSTAELLSIEVDLTKRGVGLVVLSMGGEKLDTRKPTSKLMLTILAGVATWERELMLERQRIAKAVGKYKGRPPSLDVAEIKRLSAEMGPAAIAKHLGNARSSSIGVHGQIGTSIRANTRKIHSGDRELAAAQSRGRARAAFSRRGADQRCTGRDDHPRGRQG
jgi:DNA invertase Pin-like site-specific DNA recombinase